MNAFFARFTGALACLCLAGCAWLADAPPELTPAMPDTEHRAQQQWRLTHGGEVHRLRAVVESGPQELRVLVLDSFGRRLAELSYRDAHTAIERHQRHPAQGLWPHLLQAVQLSYWPAEALEADARWRVEQAPGRRQVSFSGILQAEIEYRSEYPWRGELRYRQPEQAMDLVIQSRPIDTSHD